MKFISALLLAVCIPVQAAFVDGNELYKDLTSDSPVDKLHAIGYLAGVTDAGDQVFFCVPANVTLRQVMDMTIVLLRDSPSIRNLSGDIIVIKMLEKRWPCQKGKPI